MSKKKIIYISAAAVALVLIAVLIFVLTRVTGEVENFKKIEIDPNAVSITVEDTAASRGDTVVIPVKLNNNPGVAAIAIAVEYNKDKLLYTGDTAGDIFKSYQIKEIGNSIGFISVEDGDIDESGAILNLKFKVKKRARKGDTEIKVKVTEESLCNFDEEFVSAVGGNAAITIK
ncbi:MAG: cohesin domain-containing protein [Acutalibacteraceae bacterium]